MQNLVILAGNVGATPEARTTQGGTRITHFSLATSRPKRDSNGKILRDDNNRRLEDTEWHRITCFNGVGKTVEQYVDKGMKVMVRGRIHYTRWTDSENIERYGVEIIDEQRRVMQSLFARAVREHVVQRAGIRIVLHHQLHHHAAPLAIGGGVIKRPLHPAMLRRGERDMAQHKERA